MKIALLFLFCILAFAMIFTVGFCCGQVNELQSLRRQLQSEGAVGAPGNPLGILSTNFVFIPTK